MITLWEECSCCQKRTGVLLFLGFTSGLGPNEYTCPKCGTRFDSRRTEWRQKTWKGKAIYLTMTAFYTVLVGTFGAVFTASAIRFIQQGVSAAEYPLDAWKEFWPLGIPFAALLLALQIYRVRASVRRSPAGERTLYRASFWKFHCNPQGIAMFLMLVIPALGWLAGLILHGIPTPATP